MTAYKPSELNNLLVQKTAQGAFDEGLISEAVYTKILQRHPNTLYTPNLFIRVGLGLLTVVIGLATLILFGLFIYSGGSGEGAFTSLLVILAIASYITLEALVKSKKYYNAGTDNVLMLLTVSFTEGAYALAGPGFNYQATAVLCAISGWLCYRFANTLMGMVAYVLLSVSLYMLCEQQQLIKVVPFVLMAVSAIGYLTMNKLYELPKNLYHRKCIAGAGLLAVVSFYVCGNYYFVSEINNQSTIPASAFFWFCTLFIPIGYVLYGIQVKSLLFIRCGIVFLATGIVTLHYYYAFMPADILLMLSGILLIGISSMLIVYLRRQRRGFVLGNNNRRAPKHLQNIEAIIIAQAVSTTHSSAPQQGVQLGGGTSGGGGATGDY